MIKQQQALLSTENVELIFTGACWCPGYACMRSSCTDCLQLAFFARELIALACTARFCLPAPGSMAPQMPPSMR
jgi:hypothetical protein